MALVRSSRRSPFTFSTPSSSFPPLQGPSQILPRCVNLSPTPRQSQSFFNIRIDLGLREHITYDLFSGGESLSIVLYDSAYSLFSHRGRVECKGLIEFFSSLFQKSRSSTPEDGRG